MKVDVGLEFPAKTSDTDDCADIIDAAVRADESNATLAKTSSCTKSTTLEHEHATPSQALAVLPPRQSPCSDTCDRKDRQREPAKFRMRDAVSLTVRVAEPAKNMSADELLAYQLASGQIGCTRRQGGHAASLEVRIKFL